MRIRDIVLVLALLGGIGALAYFSSEPVTAGRTGVESPERLARIEKMAANWPTQPNFADPFNPLDPATSRGAAAQAEAMAVLPEAADGTHEFVAGMCAACHSINLVTQQQVSRARWDELLDWMVEKQGMARMEPEQRAKVLDYLDANFGAGG